MRISFQLNSQHTPGQDNKSMALSGLQVPRYWELLWYPGATCRSFGQIICHILLLFLALLASKLFANIFFFCILPIVGRCLCVHNWNKDNFETVVKWKLHGMCSEPATDTGTVPVPVEAPPSLLPTPSPAEHKWKCCRKKGRVATGVFGFLLLYLLIYLMPAARRDNNVQKT